MTTKNLILDRLGRDDCWISGEKLAAELGVSRTAVWKAICDLRDDGYTIRSVRRRGYRLEKPLEFSAASLASALEKCRSDDNVLIAEKNNCAERRISSKFDELKTLVLDETDSTNKVCREIAANGEARECVVLAASQTAGRGRLGRSFSSPEGGLYMSFLLRPGFTAVDAQLITTTAAVAVCRAIEKLDDSLKPSIKWVNDIYLRGKKVCGILTEGQFDFESGALAFAVLGIGVNIGQPEGGWPPEIADRAGALFEDDRKKSELRPTLAALIASEFYRFYPELSVSAILDDYRSRMFLTGMEVTVNPTDGEPYDAVVKGIDDELRLIVEHGGEARRLSTGEVSLTLRTSNN